MDARYNWSPPGERSGSAPVLYFHYLPLCLENSRHIIFADDTQIYFSFFPTDINEGIAALSRDATANRASAHGLELNVDKTKVMILGSQIYTSRLDHSTIPKVTVNGRELPYEVEVKNLGVCITPTLNWAPHVSQCLRKIYDALYTLKFFKHALTRSVRKNLVESLVIPHFDYACAGNNCSLWPRHTVLAEIFKCNDP